MRAEVRSAAPGELSNSQRLDPNVLTHEDLHIDAVVFTCRAGPPEWAARQAWLKAASLRHRRGSPAAFPADIDAADIVVVDATCARLPALDACFAVRLMSPSVPLVCVVQDHDVDTSVAMLKAGADDCLHVASRFDEIQARMARLVGARMSAPRPEPEEEYRTFDGWLLLERRRRIFSPAGAEVSVTAAEFDILLAMSRNPGKALGRQELLALTHFGLAKPSPRAIDVHISRLRAKMEMDPTNPQIIKTVRLGGYVFACSVTRGRLPD